MSRAPKYRIGCDILSIALRQSFREQLPLIHMRALRLHIEGGPVSGRFLWNACATEVRCNPGSRTAHLRLILPSRTDELRQSHWWSVQLVGDGRQSFCCPRCAGASPVLYWLRPDSLSCDHCCPLPKAISEMPSDASRLQQRIEAGCLWPVAEHLKAGGKRALSAMLAMEMAGLSPPRLAISRTNGAWFDRHRHAYWVRGGIAPLRTAHDSTLYAEGRLWIRR